MSRPREYYFKEGCFIEEWHNDNRDPNCSIARVRLEPKKTTKLHALKNTTERYVMLEGSAVVTVGLKSWAVEEGDVITIQPDEPQKIENTTHTDLVFLAVCTPRFEERNYKEVAHLD